MVRNYILVFAVSNNGKELHSVWWCFISYKGKEFISGGRHCIGVLISGAV